MKFKEFDSVRLKNDISELKEDGTPYSIEAGTCGVIVEKLLGDMYMVDFTPEADFYEEDDSHILLVKLSGLTLELVD